MKRRGQMLVSKILQAVLKESRYTLREISTETGVSISTLTDWQSGRTPRDLEKLRRVAHFFGHSLHEILFGEPDPLEKEVPKDWLIERIENGEFEIILRRKNDD